jgi:hypothetical protein
MRGNILPSIFFLNLMTIYALPTMRLRRAGRLHDPFTALRMPGTIGSPVAPLGTN